MRTPRKGKDTVIHHDFIGTAVEGGKNISVIYLTALKGMEQSVGAHLRPASSSIHPCNCVKLNSIGETNGWKSPVHLCCDLHPMLPKRQDGIE